MRENINFKNKCLMNNKPSVAPSATNPFAAQFSAASLQSLIHTFNSQVGSRAWTSQRALHDAALISEFQHRGIDVSSVYDGTSIAFAHHVKLSNDEKQLIIID